METFHTCATQMLKEFRALLHISPIPINSHRLLQLISLNMYAIECNALNGTELKGESKLFSVDFLMLLLHVLFVKHLNGNLTLQLLNQSS